MKVTLLSLYMKNFKGVRERAISFGQTLTEIFGKNGTGKSSIYDAFEWLLHNTNSLGLTDKGVNSFSRPRNADGSLVNDVEVTVVADVLIDDTPHKITKIQKQKFTRVRGTDQTVFKGNENTYEIDGIPKKEAEFTAFIESIIDPETFKLLTNPDYFMDLPNDDVKGKKGKMSLLLDLCGDLSDEDIINSNPEHWNPIADDVLTLGTKDATTKAKREKLELEKNQKTLPIRIDELSLQLKDVPDVSALEEEKKSLEARLESLTEEYEKVKADSSQAELRKKQIEIQNKINQIVMEETSKARTEHEALYRTYAEKKKAYTLLEEKAELLRREITRKDSLIKDFRDVLKEEGAKYKEIQGRELDSSATVCKCCGQILPREQIDKINKDFLERKKADSEASKKRGWDLKGNITKLEEEKRSLALEESDLAGTILTAKGYMDDAKKEFDASTDNPDLSDHAELNALRNELESLITKLNETKDNKDKEYELSLEIMKCKGNLNIARDQITSVITVIKNNNSIRQRLAELEDEKKQIGQNIAFAEQKIILLEEFCVTRSKMLSDKINSYFEIARFSLIDEYQSGGVNSTVRIIHDGIDNQNINNGHLLLTCIDIIRAFQKHYDCYLPLFLDNAECLSSDNQPHVDSQLIMLKVTDDPELIVKGE